MSQSSMKAKPSHDRVSADFRAWLQDDSVAEQLSPLESGLVQLLRQRSCGSWTEHQLLRAIEKSGLDELASDSAVDTLTLYRRHFLLFRALYRVRRWLRAHGIGDLEIHCLDIRILAHREFSSSLPAQRDETEAYYLDLTHLHETTQETVDTMIDGCWNRMKSCERRKPALAALGLKDPVSAMAIRNRYHALALQHHPDRGGDYVRFQQISAAMATLRRS